jgi:hypothetical protein
MPSRLCSPDEHFELCGVAAVAAAVACHDGRVGTGVVWFDGAYRKRRGLDAGEATAIDKRLAVVVPLECSGPFEGCDRE